MMRSKSRFLVCAYVVVGSLVAGAIAPLTLSQLLGLINLRTPDTAVAAEITERGVRQPVDQKMIETVRRAGGGPATMAALDKVRPRAIVTIAGVAGTNIAINGASAGRIGEGGILALNDLWPGSYEIAGELYEHTTDKRVLTLAAGTKTDVDLRLRSLYGFVSITTNAPQATIDMEGVSRFRAPLEKQRVRAGTYTIKVESPYRETRTMTLEVLGGESTTREIELSADRRALDALLVRIGQNSENRNYRQTVTDATAYLEVAHPADVVGRTIALVNLTIAHLETSEYAKAVAAGKQALDLGGTLSLDVMHHHNSGFVDPHKANLTVSKYKFLFDPLHPCTFSKGSVDSKFVGVSFDSNLRMPKDWNPSDGATAVVVKLPKPNKPTEFYTLNFFDEDMWRLNAIKTLLTSAVTRRRYAATTGTISSADAIGHYIRLGAPVRMRAYIAVDTGALESDPVDFLELKADGTFVASQQGKSATGTFTLSGNTLTLQTRKQIDTGEFEGARIIDRHGDIWIKG